MSTGVTAEDFAPLIVLFYFHLSSDSGRIKALGLGNQLELTGISSYLISSYLK